MKGGSREDLTVVLNIWKRNHFREQMNALLMQTAVPREVWIVQYENHVNIQRDLAKFKKKFPGICYIRSDKNLKYFGRFSLAINVDTRFVWLIDDDVIPGIEWLENCVNKCEKLNAIISCSGRLIPKQNFFPESLIGRFPSHFIGDMNCPGSSNYCKIDTEVDYACQSYFFKTEWLSTFWSIWPATFSSGEDIHLSATCKSRLGIRTFVLEQSDSRNSGNNKIRYGSDIHASWRQSNFLYDRSEVLKYHIIENGWKPLLW